MPAKPAQYCARCEGICTGTCQQEPSRQYDRARRNDPFHLVPYARNTAHNWHTGNRSASDSMPVCQRGRLIGRQPTWLTQIEIADIRSIWSIPLFGQEQAKTKKNLLLRKYATGSRPVAGPSILEMRPPTPYRHDSKGDYPNSANRGPQNQSGIDLSLLLLVLLFPLAPSGMRDADGPVTSDTQGRIAAHVKSFHEKTSVVGSRNEFR